MYQPQQYKKDDPEFIFKFIQNHPFATMVSQSNNLMATHIPVLVEGRAQNFKLYAHIANHNEQLKTLKDGTEILLIFQGTQGYVSSSWYTEKDISTWDYSAVHINARIKIQTTKELENSLKKLVNTFENKQNSPLFYVLIQYLYSIIFKCLLFESSPNFFNWFKSRYLRIVNKGG